MKLAILSDTHVPGRVDSIPSWVEDHIQDADLVIHAGDFDSPDTLDYIREISADFVGVRGNMDADDVDLPTVEVVEAGGLTFVVTHGTGPRAGYVDRVADMVRGSAGNSAIGICGHIHDIIDEKFDDVRILNPGSATGANVGDAATMMVGDIVDGTLSVQVVSNGQA
ncbi:metallophosphoesterase family protein [Haloferax sp. DFSO60]|uniref:metallophosphoesterase family protein n=1 Tax=Haloferax sp. DFSO60 TaxID=3388652 RepID=UPI00397DFB77